MYHVVSFGIVDLWRIDQRGRDTSEGAGTHLSTPPPRINTIRDRIVGRALAYALEDCGFPSIGATKDQNTEAPALSAQLFEGG